MKSVDIDDKLDKLIFDYHIDKHNKEYRKYVQAKKIIKKVYQNISEKHTSIVVVSEKKEDIGFFNEFAGYRSKGLIIDNPVMPNESLFSVFSGEECFLVVSINFRHELITRLQKEFKVVFDLYDYFEAENLYFTNNYYDIYASGYHDFGMVKQTYDYQDFNMSVIYLNHRKRFDNSKEKLQKLKYLEEMIFDCVYIKDFVSLKKCICMYEKIDIEKANSYTYFWNEVEKLLEEIKKFMHQRNQNDVIMYWLDCLEYGEDKDMPFLKSLDTESMCFENMHTVTPYTNATFRTLFCKSRVIEDESYKIRVVTKDESNLIQELENRDFKVVCYGYWTRLEDTLISNHYIVPCMEFSYICWNFITDIMTNPEEKYFAIVHELYTTHFPYISFGFSGEKYPPTYALPGVQEFEDSKEKRQRQQSEARRYIDKQLKFYDTIFSENMYKIYMSDHGHTFYGRFHTIMKIQQKNIIPHRYTALISYYDFDNFILGILDNNCLNNNLDKEYIIVQDSEYRHHELVLKSIYSLDIPLMLFGYQGVITKEDMLVCYRPNTTYYTPKYYRKFVNDKKMVSDERLEYLKSLMSNKFVDVESSDQFKYSKIILDGAKKCYLRTKRKEEQKWEIIYKVISDAVNSNNRVAIRGGGVHTVYLLANFEENIRKKIQYIIDKNKDCDASRWGIEVIHTNEIGNYGINCVIISSFRYRENWKKELKQFSGIKIFDIYDEMENQGIACDREFYSMNYIKEDFKVENIV